MTEDARQKPAPSKVEGAENKMQTASEGQSPEQEPEAYPLREPSEDPRWAVRIVWTWVSIAVFLLLFLITMIILGFWYD